MTIVIVYAHPHHKGHCGHILKETIKQLKANSQSYKILDLYKDNFDPRMYESEHYTSGGYKVEELTRKYVSLFEKNSTFIFIHPVWWNSMPAILKGFFDKVFLNRIAYKYKKYPIIPFPIPQRLWKGKKALLLTTTGAQNWMTWIVQGFRARIVVALDTLFFCGFKVKAKTLYNCHGKCENRDKDITTLVRRGLRWLK